MTSIPQLVAGLESRGIVLSLAQGQLRYRSPKDALRDADRAAIGARREELLDFLAARDAGRGLRMAKPVEGAFMPSVVQEMFYRFGSGPLQGKPVSLNIGMAGRFGGARAADVADAIRAAVARHETLRTRIVRHGEVLELALNRAADLDIGFVDASGAADGDDAAAAVTAELFGDHIPVESPWLFRAKVVALPGGDAAAVMAANHFISDAGTRNILLQEIQDALDRKAGHPVAARPPSIAYNAFSLGERRFLESAQGALLIDYWRRWYGRQPAMIAPSGTAMAWGCGTRIVNNFTIPRFALEKVRALAAAHGVTPFLVFLGIFCLAMARWSKMERFPLRILGDKRSRLDLADTVGLMFCADPVEISVPAGQDFAALLRALLIDYEASLALRLPGLHFFAPHCVRPGIEAAGYPNRIPAVFNYYSGGTARERAEREAMAGGGADRAWPPPVTRLAPQSWTRRSAPLFLHLIDMGNEMMASLHVLADVVDRADEQAFIDTLFRVFDEKVSV
jgi:hypothetical protein